MRGSVVSQGKNNTAAHLVWLHLPSEKGGEAELLKRKNFTGEIVQMIDEDKNRKNIKNEARPMWVGLKKSGRWQARFQIGQRVR